MQPGGLMGVVTVGWIRRAKEVLGIAPSRNGQPEGRLTSRESPPEAKSAVAGRPQIDVPETYGKVESLLREGHPLVFVSGNAGTGKTTLILHLCEVLPQRSVIVAPTGVAALNADGMTVHSFFRFPPRIQDPSEIRALSDRRLIGRLELLVVDEASMLRCDLLDSMDVFLRKNRKTSEPFGGVQLLLVGDLFQLPPVVPRHERDILEARGYENPYFFGASAFGKLPLSHVELEHVYRQADPAFIRLLNRVRVAEDVGEVVAEMNERCLGEHDEGWDVTLTGTNAQADAINEDSMEAIRSPEFLFEGQIEGKFRLDKERLPSPFDLRLKEGARVMFTKNDEDRRWVNGTTGVVCGLSAEKVEVQIGGSGATTWEVEPVGWESHEYVLDEQNRIVARKIGEYRQYPLMLAWAVTIHKSQGKTLDRILVDLGSGAFAPGQAYVALSRCRSMEGIRLARPLRASDIKCDPEIRRFYASLVGVDV